MATFLGESSEHQSKIYGLAKTSLKVTFDRIEGFATPESVEGFIIETASAEGFVKMADKSELPRITVTASHLQERSI